MRKLVMIHGRSQQGSDPAELKAAWLEAWSDGLAKAGLGQLPPELEVAFPFYGDTLDELANGYENPAEVVVQGTDLDNRERAFIARALADAATEAGLSDDDIRAQTDPTAIEAGPENWPWVLATLRALERLPGLSAVALMVATRDVYHYLRNPGVQTIIGNGVREALADAGECVVLGHSLGSVVAYDVLSQRDPSAGWSAPTFVTIGSPLGVKPIRDSLAPLKLLPTVEHWLNAYDPSDMVALHPLDSEHFSTPQPVENFPGVLNETPNRHGISGYLSDPTVARALYEALRR